MIYCVDIDDTLFFSSLIDGMYKLNAVNKPLIEKLNNLFGENTIILHTGRHWNHLDITLRQLKEHGVKYHTLVMGKPVADIYIDDKAMRPGEFID